MIFGLGLTTKIYIAVEAIDMRKGFEGLHGLVRDHLNLDPTSGHLFLFTNRGKTRLKALVWDGSGLWVCAKRLEKGRFHWPQADKTPSVTLLRIPAKKITHSELKKISCSPSDAGKSIV